MKDNFVKIEITPTENALTYHNPTDTGEQDNNPIALQSPLETNSSEVLSVRHFGDHVSTPCGYHMGPNRVRLL